jgi:hypothetical protein
VKQASRLRRRYMIRSLMPAGTPPEVLAHYDAIINEFLRAPPIRRHWAKQGLITAGVRRRARHIDRDRSGEVADAHSIVNTAE